MLTQEEDGGGAVAVAEERRDAVRIGRPAVGPRVIEVHEPRAAMPSVPETTARARPSRRRGWARVAIDVGRAAFAILVLHLFVIQISVVRGHSMEPSLLDGDRLVVDRIAYAVGEVGRYDVVVLSYPADPTLDFVKRIVGLPGDRVALEAGHVLLNGRLADESFLHVPDRATMKELVVPEGQYFVLGDNRPISCDSREFGLVPAENLKGKVRVRFWPPGRLGMF